MSDTKTDWPTGRLSQNNFNLGEQNSAVTGVTRKFIRQSQCLGMDLGYPIPGALQVGLGSTKDCSGEAQPQQ
jgi:hypothetical protein